MERLRIGPSRGLKSLRGLEDVGVASDAPGRPDLVITLQGCPDLQTLDAIPAGVKNLHLSLVDCPGVKNLDGFRDHPTLEKLLVVLGSCGGLADLSALNHIPNLRKLHLNVAGLRRPAEVLETLALSDDVQLVVRHKPQDYTHL